MKLIIDHLNLKISELENSISAIERFDALPYVHTTQLGLEHWFELEWTLKWYKDKLNTVLSYESCKCMRLIRHMRFNKKEIDHIGYIRIYKCNKCGGYISK